MSILLYQMQSPAQSATLPVVRLLMEQAGGEGEAAKGVFLE